MAILNRPVAGNLPASLTSFVGREREVAEIRGLLTSGTRLVTLTAARARSGLTAAVDVARAGPALTPREREVAILLARGCSNRKVAEALVVGQRTAEMHVSNLLNKLGLSSRTQVAVWAVQNGLVTQIP